MKCKPTTKLNFIPVLLRQLLRQICSACVLNIVLQALAKTDYVWFNTFWCFIIDVCDIPGHVSSHHRCSGALRLTRLVNWMMATISLIYSILNFFMNTTFICSSLCEIFELLRIFKGFIGCVFITVLCCILVTRHWRTGLCSSCCLHPVMVKLQIYTNNYVFRRSQQFVVYYQTYLSIVTCFDLQDHHQGLYILYMKQNFKSIWWWWWSSSSVALLSL
jgi:hypothetical protein